MVALSPLSGSLYWRQILVEARRQLKLKMWVKQEWRVHAVRVCVCNWTCESNKNNAKTRCKLFKHVLLFFSISQARFTKIKLTFFRTMGKKMMWQ